MEIVVTAPTPMVQSPVSEEEEDQHFGRRYEDSDKDEESEKDAESEKGIELIEKGEEEEMEKSAHINNQVCGCCLFRRSFQILLNRTIYANP